MICCFLDPLGIACLLNKCGTKHLRPRLGSNRITVHLFYTDTNPLGLFNLDIDLFYAHTNPLGLINLNEDGSDYYISKPHEKDKIFKLINQYLKS